MALTDIAGQVGQGCRMVPWLDMWGLTSVSQGFCFNILCVGETGLGKSTLVDTLFNTKVEGEPATHTRPGVQLQSDTCDLQESNMGLKLPVVNMVGFRGQINKEDSYEPIVEFIEAQAKSLDLLTLKKLDSKENIISIVIKSDAISKSELTKFKIKITSKLVSNGVEIYQFPTDDKSAAEINRTMNAHLPFAVMGSTKEMKIAKKMMKVWRYPW
ncbi:hypothetical protein K5549_021560, partial [Capra hircus]